MKILTLATVILYCGGVLVGAQERGTIDLLQGTWEARREKEAYVWVFSGNELRMLIDSKAEYRGKFVINDSLPPIRIDLDLDEYKNGCVVEASAVKTKGILFLNKEILNVMTGTELKDYPQNFEPCEGTVKIQFQRVSNDGFQTNEFTDNVLSKVNLWKQ